MTEHQISVEAIKQATNHAGDPMLTRLGWLTMYQETNNVTKVCRTWHISKKTFYKWLKRYLEANGESTALANRSRCPKSFPRATPPETVELIHQIRKRTGFGQRRLKIYLKNNHGISISERTLWKILKRLQDQK